jgi:hypothetical protein
VSALLQRISRRSSQSCAWKQVPALFQFAGGMSQGKSLLQGSSNNYCTAKLVSCCRWPSSESGQPQRSTATLLYSTADGSVHERAYQVKALERHQAPNGQPVLRAGMVDRGDAEHSSAL